MNPLKKYPELNKKATETIEITGMTRQGPRVSAEFFACQLLQKWI